ncbi:MAG: carboxypeptidase regulatory-like domain-containing protein [Deltaproteobacteria bacterium]|nr:carboxypeptidase regulatory-like domain-containing protein [Deltaproteobacteria bacterium]MBN2673024.1 carboxypeptidase regulatory-like domain-containing protein [Deltaproteobacteria bacterium]
MLLRQYAQSYPEIAVLVEVGESVSSRAITGLRVSAQPDEEEAEPEIRIIGGIHGNECQSVEEVLLIIEWLLAGYQTDAQLTSFIDGVEFLLIPLVNPDGFSSSPPTRTNANYVDLNRNFGFGWSQQSVFEPFSEPESRAIRDVSQAGAFNLGLSYHTESIYVNGPWNYTPFHPRDDALIDAIGDSYKADSEYEVVFGWDWYQISGDVNDWSLGTQGTFDWTIELTDGDDAVWEVHEPALRAFISWAFVGVSGAVIDAQTGLPLHAMITVEPEGEPVFTDATKGDYHRILLNGTYEVTAWAPGYRPLTVENVTVAESVTTVDFALTRKAAYTAGFQVNEMTLPRDISNSYVALVGYDNDSIASDALGVHDGYWYSIGAGGDITIDMGAAIAVEDAPGPDLLVASGTRSNDSARVWVADHQDGPFVEAAVGSGDLYVDLSDLNLAAVRYVKVVDESDVAFNEAGSGYDLDAVENLSWRVLAPPDGDTESDFPDYDSDTMLPDTDTQPDSDNRNVAATQSHAVSGCTMTPQHPAFTLFSLLFAN